MIAAIIILAPMLAAIVAASIIDHPANQPQEPTQCTQA